MLRDASIGVVGVKRWGGGVNEGVAGLCARAEQEGLQIDRLEAEARSRLRTTLYTGKLSPQNKFWCNRHLETSKALRAARPLDACPPRAFSHKSTKSRFYWICRDRMKRSQGQ